MVFGQWWPDNWHRLIAALRSYTLTLASAVFEILLAHGANPNY
jgi:hypothetical protein